MIYTHLYKLVLEEPYVTLAKNESARSVLQKHLTTQLAQNIVQDRCEQRT